VLSPESANADYQQLYPELSELKSTSLYLSSLLPSEPKGKQYSVLLNTSEEGLAPLVGGKTETVMPYLQAFLSGYDEGYRRILRDRDALRREIEALRGDMPVRLLIRNTQAYVDLRKKLCHYTALENEEKRAAANALLARIMKKNIRADFSGTVKSEIRQLLRGDIPYVYTNAGGHALYSGGECVAEHVFERSAIEHVLHNLEAMSGADERFDLALLARSLQQYPGKAAEPRHSTLSKRSQPMTRESALREAGELFSLLRELCILSPAGTPFFGYVNESDFSFRFCENGLVNGMTGIALFASAFVKISGNESDRIFAGTILAETLKALDRQYQYLSQKGGAWEYAPYLGEADGLGGILTGLALLKRYTGRPEIDSLQNKAIQVLSAFDLSRYGAPDRMIGMAGLLSALCRFPEYRKRLDLIQAVAESLLAMKKLPYKDGHLWKPFKYKNRPISGDGHGLAGIAEALFAASAVLKADRYADAAWEALAFERSAYSEKSGTWSDLRSYP
ncbi:MAG: DUF4135 domain-containing protein, partial [Clostridia bacterium]|nr:DUF4135 domain-containing protein [Clostridia bacterium]